LQPVEVLFGWMKTRLTIIILILIFPAYFAGALPLKFHSINSLYGISVRATNSVCKDDNGFIWASSKTEAKVRLQSIKLF